MKYSRDLAREKALDSAFEKTIEMQVFKAKDVGATHLAIGTPYDDEFIPFLTKWVNSARKNNLKVWFRGNFSGWEGWFGYSLITPKEHTEKLNIFISENSALFEDGDIFTSCTECENGVLGDPRSNGNLESYRDFLISEYQSTQNAFKKIEKDVISNYYPMNADVARLVMDKETAQKLGCVVVIDHYVKSPEKLNADITQISEQSGCPIVLGEFGAPIPDIHGPMNSEAQSKWISDSLYLISGNPHLLGLNYWVGFGGSTSIWELNGTPRSAVQILESYFKPISINLRIKGWMNFPINTAQIEANGRIYETDRKGRVEVPIPPSLEKIYINKKGYSEYPINPWCCRSPVTPGVDAAQFDRKTGFSCKNSGTLNCELTVNLHREKFSLKNLLLNILNRKSPVLSEIEG
jgi:hypothetical protein